MMFVSSAVEWVSDPAHAGRRWRAQMDHGDLKVYETGHWYVATFEQGKATGSASGEAATVRDGKMRALAVYEALTCHLKEV